MPNLWRTPFAAIFQTELRFNSKRPAPYALIALFSANALLWWGWGPAVSRSWATNSDFYILRLYCGFSFMTLPLFTAVLMGDPVIRDFRLGLDPLIFSKPVGRAQYLLGKFCGNFFVLLCCQACFALTLFLLQAFNFTGMRVLPARAMPYLTFFFVFVVLSNLWLAALYFTVGTLTRNVKVVYGLATSFYLLYIAWQSVVLKGLPTRWRIVLDPLLFNWEIDIEPFSRNAEWLNQFSFSFDTGILANRAVMLVASAACLALVVARFRLAEQTRRGAAQLPTSLLQLAPSLDSLSDEAATLSPTRHAQTETATYAVSVALPEVRTMCVGARAYVRQFLAATGVEFRLLRAERSMVLVLPLCLLLSGLTVTYVRSAPDGSYATAYAFATVEPLLLFLAGLTLFYTGEALHRDRELRFEPLLWSVPTPNFVLLLSKCAATFLLSLALLVLTALTAILIQLGKGHTPLDLRPFFIIYTIILLPSIVFMIGAVVLLNVLLRDKYLAYAAGIGAGGGLFYLFSRGGDSWLYNPVLYRLWTYADLIGADSNHTRIVVHRLYCLAQATALLALAHLLFERKATKRLWADGRLSGRGLALLFLLLSAALIIITGLTFLPAR